MKYFYTYEVQYQEVDSSRRLRLFTLENYLLNIAGRVADECGFGIRQLLPYGWTWVITRMNLEMTYIPTHSEILRIETWIETNAHMLSVRDYRIYLGDRLIGQARSTWVVLDLKMREIVDAFGEPMFRNVVDGEVLEMARPPRLTVSQEPPTLCTRHTIQYSDVDYNNHCNSCKYLEWMLNAHHPNVDNSGIRLDINYVKEMYLGEEMNTQVWIDSDRIQYRQTGNDGVQRCTAMISTIDTLSKG